MVEEVGCGTIFVESAPNETEYKKEYEHFYKNVFGFCGDDKVERLHFFEGELGSISEVEINDKRYLGYCDIRPLKTPTISCALIDKRVFITSNTKYLFLVCKRKFEVSFDKVKLSVEAFPYVQQDGKVVRCAQAALTTISKFWDKELRGTDFTKITTEFTTGNRSIPSQGMSGQQIGVSLSKLDKDPVLYDFTREKPLQSEEQIIYRYLESGIPVVIGIVAGAEMHALVVVGHTFTPDSWEAQTITAYYNQPKTGGFYHCCTNWIERFVVQDDNLGPYTLVHSDFLRSSACKLIAVGLPKNIIYCMAEDAETIARDLLSPQRYDVTCIFKKFMEAEEKNINKETLFWYREFTNYVKTNELVLRTYLRNSEEWKKTTSTTESYNEYKDILDNLPMPEMIWIVEVSWPQIFRHGRKLCGEIIIDPTDQIDRNLSIYEQGWLWMHFPGIIWWRNAKNGTTEISVIKSKDTIREHRFTCK